MCSTSLHARECRIAGQDEIQNCNAGSASIVNADGFVISSCYPTRIALESYQNLVSGGMCEAFACALDATSCPKKSLQVVDAVTKWSLSGCVADSVAKDALKKLVVLRLCHEI